MSDIKAFLVSLGDSGQVLTTVAGLRESIFGRWVSTPGSNEQDKNEGKVWWYEIVSVFFVCFACLCCGTFLGYTSTAVPSMEKDTSKLGELLDHHKSLISGLGPLGAVAGSLISTLPVRYIGPRKTIAYLAIPALLVSWVSIGLAQAVTFICIGRFIGGIGVGSTISCAPLYVVDIASADKRGKLGIMPQLLMVSGIFCSYTMGTWLSWDDLSLSSLTFAVIAAILVHLAPESPKRLFSQGKEREASMILQRIHGKKEAEKMLKEIESSLSSPDPLQIQNNEGEEKDTLATVKSIGVCLGVISVQQFAGINGVTFFAGSIFSGSNLKDVAPIILAFTQVSSSFISTFFVERFGRTILLKISTFVVALASGVLGCYYFFLDDKSGFSWLPIFSLVVFAFGFAIGLGPIAWILVAEILPSKVRAMANPFIIAYYWFCAFIVTTSFTWLKAVIDFYGIFWMYAIVCILGLIFTCFCVPETKGKSSDEVQQYFKTKK